ncbi:hypothetical protein TPA0910_14530 [Streptomyces hygroscopicus subsp. sporocinereus]|uniref:Uncharacterized protein n=1 Tax=Streptomyces hygroscopicus TaxID=1912 RepID=A0ABQ3TUM3_STRHY|nr:hypothetical protein [Streptomyces hygroscopicus]GHJ27020.1 hypothetical protein TPA0910_14530 [Streptomyces hygroscopicus]
MNRVPDAVAVASLDTHRLIVTVPNDGPAEVSCNLPRPVAASVLRQIADGLDSPAGRCETALATGRPCPVQDGPAALLAAAEAGPAFARGMAKAQRPAGLDALLDHVAAAMLPADDDQAAEESDALTADDVRAALDFNAEERDPALATLRDVLLDSTATRTPEQALAAARVILTAHARQVAALVEAHYRATRTRFGLTRSSRGLLTGYEGARKIVTAYADGLADEQALAEQATP